MTTNWKAILIVYRINVREMWNTGVPKWLSIKESRSCIQKRLSNLIRHVIYGECTALRPSDVQTCFVDAN
jgi:hypothetical protein